MAAIKANKKVMQRSEIYTSREAKKKYQNDSPTLLRHCVALQFITVKPNTEIYFASSHPPKKARLIKVDRYL